MPLEALLALAVTAACLIVLISTRVAPDLVLLGGLTALLAMGVVRHLDL